MAGYAAHVITLSKTARNSYQLNLQELENVLGSESIKGKNVAVISIAGAFRKGKSFMLNLFVNYLDWLTERLHENPNFEPSLEDEWFDESTKMDKFKWRGGKDRDTDGILLWSKPYILKNKEGKEVVVLLMDTQGTFDHESSVKECATIFAMSTLLASVQIFNVSQQVQEDDLNNLRLFTEYASIAKSSSLGSNKNAQESIFQKIIFLVRDWQNSKENEYGYSGGEQYIQDLLKILRKQQKEQQNLRKKIKDSFQSIECFLMPHPGQAISDNNSKTQLGEMTQTFKEEIASFVPSLFDKEELVVKKVNGKEITVGTLMELFKSYMVIFDSDELPEPKTILEATAESVNVSYEEKARNKYKAFMDSNLKNNPELSCHKTLDSFHRKASEEAVKEFESRPILGDEASGKQYRTKLDAFIKSQYDDYKSNVDHNIKHAEECKQTQKEYDDLLEQKEAEKQRFENKQKELLKQKKKQQEIYEQQNRQNEDRIAQVEKEKKEKEEAHQAEMEKLHQKVLESQAESAALTKKQQEEMKELQEKLETMWHQAAQNAPPNTSNDELVKLVIAQNQQQMAMLTEQLTKQQQTSTTTGGGVDTLTHLIECVGGVAVPLLKVLYRKK